MQRLRCSGTSLLGSFAVPRLKKKVTNSWCAVQDTYYSTKDIFERHKVVFTIATSIASVATAWAGYSIRYIHQERVDKRLAAIENACPGRYQSNLNLWNHSGGEESIELDSLMKINHHVADAELKKLYDAANSRTAAYVATAGVTLVIGYGLGWRGGIWYANRKFRKEQMKLLGQIKPKRSPFQFLRRLRRQRMLETKPETSRTLQKDASSMNDSLETSQQQL